MITGKAAGLLAGAVALLLFGLATLNSGVIALAIPLLVYLGIGFWLRPEPPQLTCTRNLSADRATVGQPITVTVTVTNAGAPIPEALIEETVLPGFEVIEGDTQLLTSLAAGETITLEYVVRAARGVHRFGGVNVPPATAWASSRAACCLRPDNRC